MSQQYVCVESGEVLEWPAGRFPGVGPRQVTECHWDDGTFLNEYASLGACHSRPDLSSRGTVAGKALLNWYMGGDEPDNSIDAILTVLYCMKVNDSCNSPLFTDQLMKDGPELQSFRTIAKIDPSMNYQSKLMQRTSPNNSILTNELATRWYNTIWTKLDVGSTDEQKQTAINVIGFLYLILLRLSLKKVENVTSFIFNKGQSTFTSLWSRVSLDTVSFCPPHEDMALSFKFKYDRRLPNCTKVVSAIVYSYYAGLKKSNNHKIVGILKASCLVALENVGLGLLTWTEQAASALDISIHELMEYNTVIPRHADTNRALKKVLNKYVSSDSGQVTWPWAQMFKDGALANLRITDNPIYAMTMIAIVHPDSRASEIWNESSLRKHIENFHKSKAVLLAQKIKQDVALDKQT
ncbi:hypothetical protein QAD02_024014 [Eretmocerus hayati]|uniref:Uncharacterized protein n=1 Tax=Eretmocerus hayati TaxID=131215 RepID=A0ACC2Q009_9HYME|nr:hypothetical protein QAD02_024014 [Eretmocerus hayati]